MTGSFLIKVWTGLLPHLGLGFVKGKPGALSDGKTRALQGKPHSSPTLPVSQQSDLLTHPPHQDPATPHEESSSPQGKDLMPLLAKPLPSLSMACSLGRQ